LSLTLSQVSPQAILATIGVIFPRNEDEDAYFDTRKEPDLSKEIRGRARWVEPSGIYSQAHYEVYYSDRWSAIEFLNNAWYWIYPSDDHWSAAKSDRVTDLRLVGLSTPLYPYIESPDLRRLRLEEEGSSDTGSTRTTPESESGEPTTDQAEESPQLEETFSPITLVPIPEGNEPTEFIPGAQFESTSAPTEEEPTTQSEFLIEPESDESMSTTETHASQVAYIQLTTASSGFGMGGTAYADAS